MSHQSFFRKTRKNGHTGKDKAKPMKILTAQSIQTFLRKAVIVAEFVKKGQGFHNFFLM
jgi:hypothetical protein